MDTGVEKTREQATVLCVDDEEGILNALARLLQLKNIRVLKAQSGHDALKFIEQEHIDAIVCDMRMPGMTGDEVLAAAAKQVPLTYRILMTGYSDLESTTKAINLGKIHRYIQKPWNNDELLSAITEGIRTSRLERSNAAMQQQIKKQNAALKSLNSELETKVQQRTAQLRKTLDQLKKSLKVVEHQKRNTFDVLYNVISMHSAISSGFAANVSALACEIATSMGLSPAEVEDVGLVAQLHEIGLIGLPQELLQIPLHQMNSAEQNQYRTHIEHAELILSPAIHLKEIAEGIRHQYERFAGDGYPEGFEGTDIPIASRILAVARDYWLLTTQRSYAKVLTPKEAVEILSSKRNKIYDPFVIQALKNCYVSNSDIFVHHSNEGHLVSELVPGMILQKALFNRDKLLLLPKDTVLTEKLITKLEKYQRQHTKPLKVYIARQSEAAEGR